MNGSEKLPNNAESFKETQNSIIEIEKEQQMYKFQKIQKALKNDFLLLFVLELILLIYSIYHGFLNFIIVLVLLFLLVGFVKATNSEKSASIYGIILGIVMIVTLDIINVLLGIFVLVRALKYKHLFSKCFE